MNFSTSVRLDHFCGSLALLLMLIVDASALASDKSQGLEGDEESIAAAETLLEAVGGRAAWGSDKQFLFTVQRAYLTDSGEIAMISIWRDLDNYTRLIRLESPSRQYSEYIGTESGWRELNGSRSEIPPDALAAERHGLTQSPYYVYRRLALRDEDLVIELADENARLNVASADGSSSCWFLIDGLGSPISWGNVYRGSVNQHYYGPLFRAGDANFPSWGAATNGAWRFEYIFARFSADGPI